MLAIMLMSRTLSNFMGVLALIENGLVVEARILVRCCFENAFWPGVHRGLHHFPHACPLQKPVPTGYDLALIAQFWTPHDREQARPPTPVAL